MTVFNLSNDEEREYIGITPREAVIAAYAQSKGDWSTWQYEERYGKLVEQGKLSVACGDWCALDNKAANEWAQTP